MKLDFRQRLLTTTLLVGASMIASPAFAQTAQTNTPSPPDNSATPSIPETTTPVEGQTTIPSTSATGENVRAAGDIVITGSRIPQPNLTSASPVTVLSSQEVKLSGTTRTEDLINSLPQSFAAQGSSVSNGATGTATVNLRGLGTTRTLVLINGRRLQPGDPRQPVADINFVPSSLIKRVDVLTGGASSVYGADAVAGVVNFIMDTNFRGLRLDGQVSTFMHYNDIDTPLLNANLAQGFRPPHGWNTNGGAQDISAAFGTSFDDNRGSLMAYATYRKQDAVLQATRDYSFCATAARTAAQGGRGSSSGIGGSAFPRDFNCSGSATSDVTSIFLRNFGNPQHVEGSTLATQTLVPGTVPFNFGPYNFFQRPQERYTFGAFAEYELSPGAKPYLEVMFMDDQTNARIAPSGNFFNTGVINCDNPLLSAQQRGIICEPATYDARDADPTRTATFAFSDQGNLIGQTGIFGPDPDGDGPLRAPLLGFTAPTTFTDPLGNTYTQGIAYIGRRNVEGGGREDNLGHTSYRLVAGVRGDLLRGLSYDAYYQYGTTDVAQVYQNDFSITRLTRALDVIDDPSTPEVDPVCRSVITGVDPNCVPYNVFQAGGVDQAALGYLQVPGFLRGSVKETVANANLTLDAGEYGVQTPWADRGVGINVGAEYRKEALETETDQAFQTGDLAGQGAPTLPVSGSFTVRELFSEVQIPVISNSFIEEFTLTAGYRYSDYKVADNHFNTDTYKIAAELAPINDVRMRASYNRAVRAPNVVELFTSQFVGLGGTIDPCAGPAVGGLVNGTTTGPAAGGTGFTAAQCARTGVTPDQFGNISPNPAGQYNALFGGNPNLAPEKADSITAGVVLQPRWVPGLAVTVDYFNIKVKNLISTLGYSTIINNCLASGDPFLCSQINRGAGSGSLWAGTPPPFIATTNVNIGGLKTTGFDINGSYSRRIGGMGTLNLSYVSTILDKLEIDTGVPGTTAGLNGKFDCAGFYGTTCGSFLSGAPNPKYRHKLRTGFTLPNGLGISGQWRYFSSVKNDQMSSDCDMSNVCAAPTAAPANQKINAQSYFDLALTARLADRYNFRLGMNNVLDRDPPIVGSEVAGAPFGNGNTFPQVYDALGRYLFAGVTIDF